MKSYAHIARERLRYYARHRYLLWLFIRRDFQARYTGSLVGLYWTFLNPLVTMGIYLLVFSTILQVRFHADEGISHYGLYLVCGIIPWLTVQDSVARATASVTDNANLVRLPNFPASLLPTHIVLGNLLQAVIHNVLALAAIAIITGKLGLSVLFLPVLVAVQFLMTLGLAWLASSVNVVYRDMGSLIQNGLHIWMFITPIFYPSGIFPKQLNLILAANPMAHLVDIYRETMMKNFVPWDSVATVSIMSGVIFAVGYVTFVRLQPQFSDLV